MKAIVLDTNIFGGGNPDLGTLRQWVRDARGIGAEVWVPEPILWELVAHLWEQIEDANQSLSGIAAALRRAELPSPDLIPYEGPRALLDEIAELLLGLGDGVQLIPCHPQDALEALMDQILLRPPAKKVKGVRTGASDSAWLRAAIRAIDDKADLVVVSGDLDVPAALRHWNAGEVQHFSNAQEARSALFAYGLGPIDLTYQILQFFNRSLLGITPLTSWAARSLGYPAVLMGTMGLPADATVLSTDVTEIDRVVGAQPARISREGSFATIEIDVSATVDVRFAPSEGSLADLGPGEATFRNLVLHLPLWVQLDNGDPVEAGLDQPASAVEAPAVWTSPQDAFEDCLSSYFRVPEHSGEELRHLGYEDWTIPIHLYGGHQVTLVSRFEQRDWTLTARAAWGELDLRCRQLPSRGQWLVTVAEDGPLEPGPPSWALSAFLIRRGGAIE